MHPKQRISEGFLWRYFRVSLKVKVALLPPSSGIFITLSVPNKEIVPQINWPQIKKINLAAGEKDAIAYHDKNIGIDLTKIYYRRRCAL